MARARKSASRTLFVSFLVIVVCLAMLLVAGAYGLEKDKETVNNHLSAGRLELTLTRQSLTNTLFSDKGELVTSTPDTTVVDFSKSTGRNLFDLNEDVKIVPGCTFEALMQLENNSRVAVGYWIEVKTLGENATELEKQLKVTLSVPDSEEGMVSPGVTVGNIEKPIAVIESGAFVQFTITVEFLDLENNNDAQDQQASFDLIVHAVQIAE